MAELAARIRAKFKRRHSAIPGIPSLLTRSSVRSSGSHSSGLLRTTSCHSHGAVGDSHNADPISPLSDTKSRTGSSHDSVIDLAEKDQGQDRDKDQDYYPQQQQQQQQQYPDGGDVVGQDQAEKGRRHNGACPISDHPISPRQITVDDNLVLDVSSTSHEHNNNVAAPLTTAITTTAVPPAPAAVTAIAPAPAPAPAPATAQGLAPTPLTAATSNPPATSHAPKTSTMSGNDLHPLSLRKLSSINEHPFIDQDSKNLQQLGNTPSPTTVEPSNAIIPILPKKRDNAKSDPATPRTPKLGPSSTIRPLHIPLPTSSFGPPSASNTSPVALYSSTSTAPPSSPLARHSQTAHPPLPAAPVRRQSLISNRQSTLIQTLLRGSQADDPNGMNADQLLPISGNMVTRKIWVKRPGASPTLVTINEDDVVDDVREMILRKYANSLGRQFDAPDLTLRIKPSGNPHERLLGPEEPMARTLDAYFPGGQSIEDALIIDVPLRRTPRASPRAGPPHAPNIHYVIDDPRPAETANDYFGPGALSAAHLPLTVTAPSTGPSVSLPHSISVLSTGQVPHLPSSPGGTLRARNYRERPERPRLGRQHTSSPTLINLASGAAHQGSIAAATSVPHGTHPTNIRNRSRAHSEASDQTQTVPQPPPMPTPPAVDPGVAPKQVSTPPPRVSSPRLNGTARSKKSKKNTEHPALPKGMLNGTVPPINVLIVEDNIINLKLLEAFVKRLKVRWSTAMNGRDAVTKWRDGGFHLVLMDIQLPVMSGLDATREIRRLERVNSIGVFSSAASTAPVEVKDEPDEKDKLENMELFKSPVIIVALTASSLQSDRHEALAAGCNDFLTKVCLSYYTTLYYTNPPPLLLSVPCMDV